MMGGRRFVPDKLVSGVLDYKFVGFGVEALRIFGLGRVLGTNSHGFNYDTLGHSTYPNYFKLRRPSFA